VTPRLSVVIPAHNEAAVIQRVLRPLVAGARSGALEVVVSANGCTDDTVALARAVGPEIHVVETTTASKIAALNLADEVASVFPRAYVDADVDVDLEVLLRLADTLSDPAGPLVAAPPMRVDTSRSSWPVRAHYRIWELTDYRRHGHIGSGIYAMSVTGRRRFGEFPDIIADDRFVQQMFSAAERGTSAGGHFTIHAPTTLRAMIHRSIRSAAGNAQLRATGLAAEPTGPSGKSGFATLTPRVLRRPQLWPAFAVYCYAYVAPRVLARRKLAAGAERVWERDETSRR
jgi:glycosyltransferase involved in cell wall biosynthesis